MVPEHDYSLSFFGGIISGLLLDITPMEMLEIRLGLPVINGGTTEDVFSDLTVQVGINLDFGTLAFTYRGSAADNNNGSAELRVLSSKSDRRLRKP
ncbi:MAG: hypothetical protein FWB78_06020 [Treponema sp.]|nr:hypothetical protein [Treponema sp.]